MSESALWTGLGLVAPLKARVSGAIPAGVGGLSIDTRTLSPGDLFFAIKGENSDGHNYLSAAFEKGASACVVDEAHASDLGGSGSLYVVRDVLSSLEDLGRAARARTSARIVAVTGSVGKTGTKEALRLVFAAIGPTHASVASYNNHWGVPLTLARMPRESRFGVFEIGMNHAGEITPLVAMVRPHVALVTIVAPVHLEFFDSVDSIARAKAEIFSGLEAGGTAIVNHDNAQYDIMVEAARQSPAGQVLSFGAHEAADARLLDCEPDESGSLVTADILGTRMRYRLGAPGRHMAMNSLAVLLAAQAAGVSVREACEALQHFVPPVGRGECSTLVSPTGPFTLIDESYNANPVSMRAALSLLGQAPKASKGRRIAVLGDMLELGGNSPVLHRELADDIASNRVDMVYAAGPQMKHLFDALPRRRQGVWRPSSAELEAPLAETIAAGDIVMVKGSNGSRMGAIVKTLKSRFAPDASVERGA
ncbi:MAG TPA: UDP-N-acetylmuramoylalanyl-D-glutamyl-2,6-diaminopimelate--D-alanyl-D-alanine ligase [Beijerinckiaceae bacterium]|nr:UDP-N-acetylmuramoylalanyl-D-glutamyl-2,6-diaminopimelate--D-alanyl-D-alanine ligase [Beijerinckiaceae bacterium]